MNNKNIQVGLLLAAAWVSSNVAAQEVKAAAVAVAGENKAAMVSAATRTDGQVSAAAAVAKTSGKAASTAVELELRGQIVEIGPLNQTLLVRVPDGSLVAVTAGPQIKTFKHISVGDEVVVQALLGVAVSIDAHGGSGIRERVDTKVENGQAKGAAPFKAVGREVQLVGTVERWNPKSREVTIRGVSRRVSLKVPARINVEQVREGAEVRATFTEAMAIGVAAAKP